VELAGKHVVITGAASGIGRACATRFAADGARVVIADLDGERAEAVAREIDARAVRTDVSREADIATLVATAEERGGPIDLFFSNAGVGGPPGGPEADDAGLQMAWQVNVMAHGSAPLLAGGLLDPDEVADAVVAGIAEERFLILPHGDVAKHIAFKGAQPERWLEGMRGLLRQARDQSPPA
jgi:hypothetical protein